jgi:hypothetical protein
MPQTKQQKQLSAEEREFRRKRAELEAYQDIRDDLMGAVRDSGMSFQDIHGRCGPCPGTLERWAKKETDKPQLGKLRATARIIGLDIGLVDRRNVIELTRESAA